eukprot:CAMPEP_0194027396 /NCGR_PEP_ID=MMETSP0009_2-20130614/1547_1 /TAXON_ID=210454 /ORGANISM="Grammatophora oceanica, Strain CCMP 410" /LENGTH=668 /DNA_ID=CAMNT_0038666447 /DNA_START=466 /DNA_END=2472 /DNA_ORIENTATION=+
MFRPAKKTDHTTTPYECLVRPAGKGQSMAAPPFSIVNRMEDHFYLLHHRVSAVHQCTEETGKALEALSLEAPQAMSSPRGRSYPHGQASRCSVWESIVDGVLRRQRHTSSVSHADVLFQETSSSATHEQEGSVNASDTLPSPFVASRTSSGTVKLPIPITHSAASPIVSNVTRNAPFQDMTTGMLQPTSLSARQEEDGAATHSSLASRAMIKQTEHNLARLRRGYEAALLQAESDLQRTTKSSRESRQPIQHSVKSSVQHFKGCQWIHPKISDGATTGSVTATSSLAREEEAHRQNNGRSTSSESAAQAIRNITQQHVANLRKAYNEHVASLRKAYNEEAALVQDSSSRARKTPVEKKQLTQENAGPPKSQETNRDQFTWPKPAGASSIAPTTSVRLHQTHGKDDGRNLQPSARDARQGSRIMQLHEPLADLRRAYEAALLQKSDPQENASRGHSSRPHPRANRLQMESKERCQSLIDRPGLSTTLRTQVLKEEEEDPVFRLVRREQGANSQNDKVAPGRPHPSGVTRVPATSKSIVPSPLSALKRLELMSTVAGTRKARIQQKKRMLSPPSPQPRLDEDDDSHHLLVQFILKARREGKNVPVGLRERLIVPNCQNEESIMMRDHPTSRQLLLLGQKIEVIASARSSDDVDMRSGAQGVAPLKKRRIR